MIEAKLKHVIRNFSDYPKEGIQFKDISPILQDMDLYNEVVAEFEKQLKDLNLDCIAGVESRGFWFGLAIAQALKIPFIPIRKKGKLPGETIVSSYDLEYGAASIEIQKDVLQKDQRVLIHDDLLATGGTAIASAELIKLAGAKPVGFAFLVNLRFLKADEKLKNHSENIISLVNYN